MVSKIRTLLWEAMFYSGLGALAVSGIFFFRTGLTGYTKYWFWAGLVLMLLGMSPLIKTKGSQTK